MLKVAQQHIDKTAIYIAELIKPNLFSNINCIMLTSVHYLVPYIWFTTQNHVAQDSNPNNLDT